MSREFDFVVFGATGFTGKYVCAELYTEIKDKELKWAIAGRNKTKLEGVVDWLITTDRIASSDRDNIGLIAADVDDQQSLFQMCKRTKVVLDCVGPFRFYGEQVVKACLDGKCDYVDITGEPEYLDRIENKYHEEAAKKGIYIVGACGFDCIPSDLGVVYARKMFPGTLGSVENYFSPTFGPKGITMNYGTYASLVTAINDIEVVKKLRKSRGVKSLPFCGPKLKNRLLHRSPTQSYFGVPFLGPDPDVVERTQRHFHQKCGQFPVQFKMYATLNLKALIGVAIFGIILKLFTLTSWGTRIMLNHPRFFTAGWFSFTGPTEEEMEQAGFNHVMYCRGYKRKITQEEMSKVTSPPDQEMIVKITGPELAYVTTPIVMVQSAICMVEEKSKLPPNGGVYPPGYAFAETNIIENMHRRGLTFEVISK